MTNIDDFEKWYWSNHNDVDYNKPCYEYGEEAWQACSAHYEARIKQLEQVVSTAYDTFNANGFTEDETLAMRMCKCVFANKP